VVSFVREFIFTLPQDEEEEEEESRFLSFSFTWQLSFFFHEGLGILVG